MSTVIKGSASGQINLNDTTGSIQLNGSDVLTIDSSGNLTAPNDVSVTGDVGIGTSSPQRQLHIHEPSSDGSFIHLTNDTTGSTGNDGFDVLLGSDENGYLNMRESNSLIFKTADTERMRINNGGEINFVTSGSLLKYRFNSGSDPYLSSGSIGCAYFNASSSDATAYAIVTNKDSASTMHHICFKNLNSVVGTISTTNYNTAYNTSSDYRLKENITPMTGGIDKVKLLKPCTWTWIGDGSFGQGFVAHEAQEVVSEAVHGTKDEVNDEGNPVYQGIDQSKLVPLLTAALQEAITKIEDLETRIQALESA